MEDPDLSAALDVLLGAPKRRKRRRWYQRHDIGWRPARRPMTTPAPQLAKSSANQVCSIAYRLDCTIEEAMQGARLYYPLLGTLWQYLSTFIGPEGDRYFMVKAIDRLPGYGIKKGSIWAAQADKFRRV